MKSNVYLTSDDKLGALLKDNRPMPNEEYQRRIADTLWEIRTPEPYRIRRFAVRKSFAFAAIVVLMLAMCAGTAFALEYLFANVFGNANTQIDARIGETVEQYASQRENMEGMSKADAAALDAKMDFDATNDPITRSIMRSVVGNAVIVGQSSAQGIVLSEFAVYDTPGVDATQARHLYFAFAAPLEMQLGQSVTIWMGGYKMAATRWDVPLKESEAEQYAIFECLLNRSTDNLPEQSLIIVRLDKAQFCFQYDWGKKMTIVPQNDAQRAAWLAQGERLSEKASTVNCVCLSAPLTKDGITVAITELSLEGNVLRIGADIAGAADLEKTCAATDSIILNIKGSDYHVGTALQAIRILPDDFDFSSSLSQKACWEITLPYHASELAGEEIQFRVTLKTTEQTSERQPQYDFRETAFEFRITIS